MQYTLIIIRDKPTVTVIKNCIYLISKIKNKMYFSIGWKYMAILFYYLTSVTLRVNPIFGTQYSRGGGS